MSSKPYDLWRFAKFIILNFLLWLKSSEVISGAHNNSLPLPDDEVWALNIIAEKLELKGPLYFTATSYCNKTSVLTRNVGFNCDCSYESFCHISDIVLTKRGLTGVIPEEIACLDHLKTLVLSQNKLHGSIPAALGNLSFLYKLDLSYNRLSGHIPRSLGNLNLRTYQSFPCPNDKKQRIFKTCAIFALDLSMNQLDGPIPEELGNIAVSLSSNRLSGGIPESFGNLEFLTSLDLRSNLLTGSIPPLLGNNSYLQHLKLNENNLSGTLPPELANLANLQTLWLQSNYFVGDLPEGYARLQMLRSFSIAGNYLSGPFPNFVNNWTSISTLSLHGNNFRGPIFPEIFNLPYLTKLTISDVEDSSFRFPPNAKSTGLMLVEMKRCSITGKIPTYFGNMSGLYYLDLSFNHLSGEIPNFSGSNSLQYMSFANNMLQGTIPAWIGAADGTKIDLSYNNLSMSDFNLPRKGHLNLYECCISSINVPNKNIYLKGGIEKKCPGGKHYSLFINCGGGKTKIGGNEYDGDNETSQYYASPKGNWAYSSSGGFFTRDLNSSEYIQRVKYGLTAAEEPLYENARLSPASLKYHGFCLLKGKYNVILHFAEIVYTEDEDSTSSLKRIFDVYIQDEKKLTDFNIRTKAGGPNKITEVNLTANVSDDGLLEIHLYWAGKGSSADPPFLNGPLISAIAVTPDFKLGDKKLSHLQIALITVASIVLAVLLVLPLAWAMGWLGKEELHGETYLLLQPLAWAMGWLGKEELHELKVGQENPVTLKQLKDATRRFSKDMEIGKGNFGTVYRAQLPNQIVAVKRFFTLSNEGINKLTSENYTSESFRHKNLVRLFDVYVRKGLYLMVYEYMENGSLKDALFDPKSKVTLDWRARFKICLGIARGLQYLHERPRLKMVHRGIKAANILLDATLNAKISDFGNSVLYAEDDQENQFKVIKDEASHGYMAPDYLMYGTISYKYDVYGYGVVILEIVSGKKNKGHNVNQNQLECLVDEVCLKDKRGKLLEMIDKSLTSYDADEAITMLKLAVKCINISPSVRPTMSEIVSVLTREKSIDDISDPDISNDAEES